MLVPSVAICVIHDRQFHPERLSSLQDVIELAMSHRKTYRVIVPPKQSVPKRLPLRRTILPVKTTTEPNTGSAVHDKLLAHEEVTFLR